MSNNFSVWRAARLLSASALLVAAAVWAAPAFGQETQPTQPTQPQEQTTTPATQPAAEPLFREYKGVTLNMSAGEARGKLGRPEEQDKVQDFFVFSPTQRARVYYDDKGRVSAVIVTYIGKNAGAPDAKAVLGEELTPNPDGSAYKLVRYPQAGYWVAYSRTAGDEPLTIITMQRTQASDK